MKLVDDLDVPWPVLLQLRVKLPGPEHVHASCRERTTDERPIGLDDAEHAVNGDFVPDDTTHDIVLLDHAVNEPGPIAATNQELLNRRQSLRFSFGASWQIPHLLCGDAHPTRQ